MPLGITSRDAELGLCVSGGSPVPGSRVDMPFGTIFRAGFKSVGDEGGSGGDKGGCPGDEGGSGGWGGSGGGGNEQINKKYNPNILIREHYDVLI